MKTTLNTVTRFIWITWLREDTGIIILGNGTRDRAVLMTTIVRDYPKPDMEIHIIPRNMMTILSGTGFQGHSTGLSGYLDAMHMMRNIISPA